MANVHINDTFNCFTPNDEQVARILENITQTPKHTMKIHLRRKPLAVAFSLIIVVALFIGIFPIINFDNGKGLEFSFVGLTITAHAMEMNNGTLTFDVQFFEKFDKVEINVSKGTITTDDNKDRAVQAIFVYGDTTLTWYYDDTENAILSFTGWDANGVVMSEGSLNLSTGEILVFSSYPEKN